MDGLSANELYDKYKSGAADEVNSGKAKEWFGIIIGYPLPGSRMAITWKLDKEATAAYKEGRYEEALDRFCHWLALIDTDPSIGECSEMRATLTSNVGACLAALGNSEAAVEFYERSAQEFRALPFSVLRDVNISRIFYGKLVDNRVEYIESKIADLKAGKPPQLNCYQDGFGKTRTWKPEEMEGKLAFSWYDPTTWSLSSMLPYKRLGEQRTTVNDEAQNPNSEMI